MDNKAYHKLLIWQKAHEFVKEIYKITEEFPRSEIFGLTPQLRRAAVSVAANIVEGHSKPSKKEFLRFLYISLGSITESEYYLELALELNLFGKGSYERAENLRKETAYLLTKFIKAIRINQ